MKILCVILVMMFAGCSSNSNQHAANNSLNQTESLNQEFNRAEAVVLGKDQEETDFKPFVVYRDKGFRNRFTPSGYMPNGECLDMKDSWSEMCQSGKTCIRVNYDIGCSRKSRNWAGIYWLNPPDNWGDRKGGYNLTGAKRLTFWARGENGGERIEEFKMGGVGRGYDYPDSDSAYIGPVILSKEWRQYSIDLRGKNLTYISGGFAWVANTESNDESCTFYLDEIEYQ